MQTRRSLLVGALASGSLVLALAVTPPRAACAVISDAAGPGAAALEAGLAARQRHRRQVSESSLWTLIDYSLPFTAVRLWVLDAEHDHAVLMESRVSHAWRSGVLYATTFSNQQGSYLSSPGSFVTAEHPYTGRFGRSLRVRGLDPGVNDNVLQRAIIFHPSDMTHSLGCFMLPEAVAPRIVNAIAGGTFVYVHAPQS
jgi:hypothetical protein